MAGTPVTFNANSLQTSNIVIEDIDHNSAPTQIATQYEISHDNQSVIPYVTYPNKKIPVSGYVYSLISIADCDYQIDLFKSLLTGIDLPLVIGYGPNGTRTYTATPTNIVVKRPGGLLYAPFTFDFLCNYPFGFDPTTTTAWNISAQTTQPLTNSFTFTGTAPYQLPIITITVGSVTGGSNAQVSFSNAGTGQQISVTRTWAANDVLVIDCTQKTVYVNGVPTAFTGAFPEFGVGTQSMEYSDSFTTRSVSVSVIYTASYL